MTIGAASVTATGSWQFDIEFRPVNPDTDETVFIVVALNVEGWADWASSNPVVVPAGIEVFVDGVTVFPIP